MFSVCFVCLGNICRSPMCESIFTYLLKEKGIKNISVFSAGTSSEEYGNPVHHGTVRVLSKHGIPVVPHRARNLTRSDYAQHDLFVCMEYSNYRSCERIFGDRQKLALLMDYAGEDKDVADPWYTGNFDVTFEDCIKGCKALLEYLEKKEL